MLILGKPYWGAIKSRVKSVFLIVVTICMIGTATVLWWKLTREQHQNAVLRREVSKLRSRLHNLLP